MDKNQIYVNDASMSSFSLYKGIHYLYVSESLNGFEPTLCQNAPSMKLLKLFNQWTISTVTKIAQT